MIEPLSSPPLSGTAVAPVSLPASPAVPVLPAMAPPHAAASESVPVPNATSAARDSRTDGEAGRGAARNDAPSETPQNGHVVSLTRTWREQPGQGRRWERVIGVALGKVQSSRGGPP